MSGFFTRYSPSICLTISSLSPLTAIFVAPSSLAFSSPVISSAILGDVVRGAPDESAERHDRCSILGTQHDADAGRPGVSTASPVELNRDRLVHAWQSVTKVAR